MLFTSFNWRSKIQKFGKYWLCDKIGAGGMAEIFIARHQGFSGFDRTIAIKRILPNVSENSEFTQMFINEARIAARLQHSSIAHIYDFGVIENSYFMAMEYIRGKNLMAILKELQRLGLSFTQNNSVFVAIKLCEALAYAHKATDNGHPLNLVHRDVSPQNVIISYEGDVKVIDFGIASVTSKFINTPGTTGQVKGKFSYMAPEQAEGRAVSPQSDIFSAGIVLYEMLSGRPLFTGDTDVDTINQVKRAIVPKLADLGVDVPDRLANIVYKALQKDPQYRYRNAEEMASDLSRHLYATTPDYTQVKLSEFVSELFSENLDKETRYNNKLPQLIEKAEEDLKKKKASQTPAPLLQSGKHKPASLHQKPMKKISKPKNSKLQIAILVFLLALTIVEAGWYLIYVKPEMDNLRNLTKSMRRTTTSKTNKASNVVKELPEGTVNQKTPGENTAPEKAVTNESEPGLGLENKTEVNADIPR